MNLRRIAARTAVAGVTTALAASALVGATGVAAHAETGTASYNCTTPLSPDQVIPVSVSVGADLSALPPLPTGFAAPAGSLPVDVTVTIPEAVVTGLKQKGINALGLKDSDVKLPFGTAAVPLDGVEAAQTALPATGDMTIPVEATNGEFKLPDPGNIPVKMPASFLTTADTNLVPLALTCTISGDQPTITSLTVIKQSPTLTLKKSEVSIKKGKVAKLVATVAGNVTPTGKVIAKEGKKVVGTGTLKKGTTTISIKNLKPGSHQIVLSYAGDKRSNASNEAGAIVTVKK
jgi:hypothetical protein